MREFVERLLNGARTNRHRSPELGWLADYLRAGEPMGGPLLLNLGESWASVPEGLVAAMQVAPHEYHGYHLSHEGLPGLVEAASEFMRRSYGLRENELHPQTILITTAGTRSVMFDLARLISDRDGSRTVHVPSPGWDYTGVVTPLGFKVQSYSVMSSYGRPGIGFDPAEGDLVVVNAQHNPTGLDAGQEWVDTVVDLAKSRNCWLLIDEAYHDVCDPNHRPSNTLQAVQRSGHSNWLLVRSLGKHFCCNGWGLGVCCGPDTIINSLVHTYRRPHAYCYHGMLQQAMANWMLTSDADLHVREYRQRILSNKSWLTRTFASLGIRISQSPCTPYQLIPIPHDYAQGDVNPGLFVRDCVLATGVLLYELIPRGSAPAAQFVRVNCGLNKHVLQEAFERMFSWGYPSTRPALGDRR